MPARSPALASGTAGAMIQLSASSCNFARGVCGDRAAVVRVATARAVRPPASRGQRGERSRRQYYCRRKQDCRIIHAVGREV